MYRNKQTYEQIEGTTIELPYTYRYGNADRVSTIQLSLQRTLPTGDIGLHISKGTGTGKDFKVFGGIVLPISLKQQIGTWLYNVAVPQDTLVSPKVNAVVDALKGLSKEEMATLKKLLK